MPAASASPASAAGNAGSAGQITLRYPASPSAENAISGNAVTSVMNMYPCATPGPSSAARPGYTPPAPARRAPSSAYRSANSAASTPPTRNASAAPPPARCSTADPPTNTLSTGETADNTSSSTPPGFNARSNPVSKPAILRWLTWHR